MGFQLDYKTKEIVQRELMDLLKSNNLIVVDLDAAQLAIEFQKKQNLLMAQKSVTAYQIEKFKLLGKITSNTIKNMVADGRIYEHEFFRDNGVLRIMTEAIRRLKK